MRKASDNAWEILITTGEINLAYSALISKFPQFSFKTGKSTININVFGYSTQDSHLTQRRKEDENEFKTTGLVVVFLSVRHDGPDGK